MASQFIGYNVLVTLRAPPNAKVQGQVANVIGQRLMLQNVILSWSGQHLPTYSIEAPDIADLSLGPSNLAPSQPPYQAPSQVIHPPISVPPPQSFVDPAILSVGKPPQKLHHGVEAGGPLGTAASVAHQVHPAQPIHREAAPPVSAALTEPFSNLELSAENIKPGFQHVPQENELDASVPDERVVETINHGKQKPRGGRNKLQKDHMTGSGPVNEHDGATNTNPKSKGWRQTAFVEPSHPHMLQSPKAYQESAAQLSGRRRKKKHRGAYAEDTNGWATEDATDIQELGEFDFQSNLSKFDKRRVFEEIRNYDTTADEDRLVSFNRRVPKPGTNGGKNLHWTENVLDSPQDSENGDYQEPSDARLSSENYSGREVSRARSQTSRKSSTILGQPIVPQINTLGRSQLSTSRTTSPRPPKTPISASPMNGPNVSGASLRLTTTNRSCPTVSPLQTLEVEQIAVVELGLTEDMITENAGRGIAEAAVGLLPNDSAAPTVLVLTGNHRTGARAVSAARHLRNRGHRVTVCMLGLEHESELLESCRKQLDVFKKIGGRVLKWEELSPRLATSDFGPDLVVDGLFGIHIAFDDLRTDDQGTAFEMIGWVNRSNIDVMSVDVPSGLSASSGEVTTADGSRLCINSKSVVCLGAPKTGVVSALLSGEGTSWSLSVADIGIPQIVWRKYGTRRRHGIDFGNRWVVPLRFQVLSA